MLKLLFADRVLTNLAAPTRSGPPVGHVFVPALIQMPNYILGGRRGDAPDGSVEWGESWRQRKGGSISRVCGYGEEG